MSEPKIGDNICFVAKDEFINNGYKTIAITISNQDDLDMIDDYFNNEQFVQAFKADSIKESIELAKKFITTKQRAEKYHSKFMENPPGQNSYVVDKRHDIPNDKKHIKLIPTGE